MKHGRPRFEQVEQVLVVYAVVGRDEVRTTEPELGWSAAGDENRRVVDGNRDDLFVWEDKILVP